MPERLKCECGFELSFPTQFCLNCGKKHAIACGIYVSREKLYVLFVGLNKEEVLSLRRYEKHESLVNLYEVAAERIYERRIEEVVISGESDELISEAFEMLKNSFYPFKLARTDAFPNQNEFFSRFIAHVRVKSKLKRVELPPEEKIQGSHSTIIGEREGYTLILRLASSPYVKKIVPGVIESSGSATGGGVRLKITRCDEKGNIRALLIDGATVQQIHVITTASNKEEGEEILRMLKSALRY